MFFYAQRSGAQGWSCGLAMNGVEACAHRSWQFVVDYMALITEIGKGCPEHEVSFGTAFVVFIESYSSMISLKFFQLAASLYFASVPLGT